MQDGPHVLFHNCSISGHFPGGARVAVHCPDHGLQYATLPISAEGATGTVSDSEVACPICRRKVPVHDAIIDFTRKADEVVKGLGLKRQQGRRFLKLVDDVRDLQELPERAARIHPSLEPLTREAVSQQDWQTYLQALAAVVKKYALPTLFALNAAIGTAASAIVVHDFTTRDATLSEPERLEPESDGHYGSSQSDNHPHDSPRDEPDDEGIGGKATDDGWPDVTDV